MSRIYIISNYNYDPTEVINAIDDDYILCQQGDDSKVPDVFKNQSNFKMTKHTGHNISDYLQYIIENYKNLPNEVGFIKGNIFPRHIEKNIFLSRLKQSGFIPLYSDEKTYQKNIQRRIFKKFIAQQIAPGIYLEIANDWYVKTKPEGKYFPLLSNLYFQITNRILPEYITMVPGACMIIPRENILRWDESFYRELYEAVTYEFFPVEAYHVERCMLYLFYYLKE